jgi:hypothetical protein
LAVTMIESADKRQSTPASFPPLCCLSQLSTDACAKQLDPVKSRQAL